MSLRGVWLAAAVLLLTAAAARAEPASLSARLRGLRELVALDEALGDHGSALQKLSAALAGELGKLEEPWQHRLDIELTMGDTRAALTTARTMLQRFGNDRHASERVAQLQLTLGDAAGALSTLSSARLALGQQDESWLLRLAALSFEVGDQASERAAYRKLIELPGAAAWQYQRLYELAPDRLNALAVALAAYERLGSVPMLYAAAAIYEQEGDEAQREALLARAERNSAVAGRADYWRARIDLHAQRALRAQRERRYPVAAQELERALALCSRAAGFGALRGASLRVLQDEHAAMLLSLGLTSRDPQLIARGYEARQAQLSVRERVYVLQQLGRKDEALAQARAGLAQPGLSEEDRAVLEADARALTERYTSQLRTRGDTLQMNELNSLGAAASLEYGERSLGLRAEAGYTWLSERTGSRAMPLVTANDLTGSLRGHTRWGVLELGVHVRDERTLRPFGALSLQLAGERGAAGLALQLRGNAAVTDTALLRIWGVRDGAELEGVVSLGKRFYLSARGGAEVYSTREERLWLGSGLNLESGVGLTLPLSAALDVLGLRLVGRLAPRFARVAGDDPRLERRWLPQSSAWAGVGASVGRGSLEQPPRVGRRFVYVLDGAAGWLWPLSGVGFSVQAGMGVSLLGEDLLTLAARSGNVVGGLVWSATLGYALSLP